MALLTLSAAMAELGIKSRDSLYKLEKRGDLKFVRILISGTRPAVRVDSRELDAFKRKLATAADNAAPPPVTGVTASSSAARRRRPPSPQLASVIHFE